MKLKKEDLIKGGGIMVRTKSGSIGTVYNNDSTYFGKVKVRFDDGTNLLCAAENLEIIGYVD